MTAISRPPASSALIRPPANFALIRAALAGAASGARSLTGLAALTVTADPNAVAQPDRTLARPWVKATAAALAALECTLDKLPSAPSRLQPPGLAARLAGAAASAIVITRRAAPDHPSALIVAGQDEVPAEAAQLQLERVDMPARLAAGVVVSASAAVATAWLGVRWRTWARARFGQDWTGAGLEDAAAITVAAVAALASWLLPRPRQASARP